MLRREEPQMLAVLNGLVFGGFALWIAVGGRFTPAIGVYSGLSALFWISAWFAGRHELRPLIATWVGAIGAFVWSQGASVLMLAQLNSIFAFSAVLALIPAAYLVLGLFVSVLLYRETRGQRARQKRPLLERQGQR